MCTTAAAAALASACGPFGRPRALPSARLAPTTLELWALAEGDVVDGLVQRFRSHAPQVTVNRSEGGGLTKVQTAIAAGTPPDVAGAIIADLGTIGSRGLAESLTQLLRGQPGWQPDGYLPGLRAVHTYRGELIAAPYVTNTTPVAINLELLERANLRLPAATWTWDTLAEYAARMTVRAGPETAQWGYAAPFQADFTATNDFNTVLNSFGGSYVDAAGQRAAFAGPEGQAALEWLVNLVRGKQASPLPWPPEWLTQTGPLGPRGRGFANAASGGAAMIPLETGGLKPLEQLVSFRWQLVLPPRQKKLASHSSAGSWFIVKGAPHRAAATEFVRFGSLPEQLAWWALFQERIPPHEAAAARPEWQEYVKRKPAMGVYMETAKGAVTYPAIGGWAEARAAVATAIADALAGKATPRAVLEDAARLADAAFARARGG